ncbi:MAG TPA: hypothetical protein VN493_31890 [Thermoanaerobaculia bacterium]|nr:hypothetical protein [Thermoanaerobaculia bacterium]
MTFKVIDLMVSVGNMWDDPPTCTTVTKPTGCVNPSDRGEWVAHDLSVLKDQLREVMFRS